MADLPLMEIKPHFYLGPTSGCSGTLQWDHLADSSNTTTNALIGECLKCLTRFTLLRTSRPARPEGRNDG